MIEDENDLIPRAQLSATGSTIHDTNMYIGNIRSYSKLIEKYRLDQTRVDNCAKMLAVYRRKLEVLIATGDPKKAREI